MGSFHSTVDLDGQSFIIAFSGTITEVSQAFAKMTEYTAGELVNKNIEEVFRILKVCPITDIRNIDEGADYFLFTKSLEARTVNIKIKEETGRKIYILTEKPDSRLEDKFDYLCLLASSGMAKVSIFSVPDLILLKTNKLDIITYYEPYDSPENSLGKSIRDIVPGLIGSTYEQLLSEVIEEGKPKLFKEFEFNALKRGTTYWDATLVPIKEDGRVRYFVIDSLEVTDRVLCRKKVQEQMEEIRFKNKQLKAIIESVSGGLLLIDKNNKYTMLNKQAEGFFYDPGSIMKKGDSTVHTKYYDMDGNEIKLYDLPSDRVLRGEKIKQFYIKIIRPDKTMYCCISGSPIYDEEGNVEYAVLCGHEITDMVKYQQELKEQKGHLNAILENMTEGLIASDTKGEILNINSVALRMHGMDYQGDCKHFKYFIDNFDLFYLDGRLMPLEKRPMTRALSGDTFTGLEAWICRKGTSQSWIASFGGTPIYNMNGELVMAIITFRDITKDKGIEMELKEQQEMLLKAEREKNEALEKAIEMKDDFLSLISHEFRTPLNVINAAVQTLNFIYANDLPEKVKEYIGIIRQNTFRQLRLVNNLLDITRANAGSIKTNRRNIDIAFLTRAITESVYQFAAQKRVRVAFISSFERRIVGIDDEKYERILLNLLSNAIKFTPEGKSITVKLHAINGSICIEVKDDGIGIPPNKKDMIFERFGQVDSLLSRQAEGTGIGLSLVKKFVEALGGSVSVKSKLGKGSTFTVMLPDEKADEDSDEKTVRDLMDNRLVQVTNVEFSDIYL